VPNYDVRQARKGGSVSGDSDGIGPATKALYG